MIVFGRRKQIHQRDVNERLILSSAAGTKDKDQFMGLEEEIKSSFDWSSWSIGNVQDPSSTAASSKKLAGLVVGCSDQVHWADIQVNQNS